VKDIPNPAYGFGDKVGNLARSPYERTVYLDGDVYVHDGQAIYDIFDMLERFDFVGAQAMMRTAEDDWPLEFYRDEIPDGFPLLNSGVIGFRNTGPVESVLNQWASNYHRDRKLDNRVGEQPALRAALYASDLQIGTLPREYNFRIPYEQLILGEAKIFHGRASNMTELVETVNSAEVFNKGRIYVPIFAGRPGSSGKDMHVVPLMNPRKREVKIRRLLRSVREHGVLKTTMYLLLGGVNDGYTRVDKFKNVYSDEGASGALRRVIEWARS
jgi:hypothetical protein